MLMGRVTSLATRLSLVTVAFYFFCSLLIFLAYDADAKESLKALNKKQKQELIYLLTQDCGSCHGLTLQGGLGPPLLKKNLKGKPKAYLTTIIKHGRSGTPMPPWKDILTDQQINFLADYLLSDKNVLASYQFGKKPAESVIPNQSYLMPESTMQPLKLQSSISGQ